MLPVTPKHCLSDMDATFTQLNHLFQRLQISPGYEDVGRCRDPDVAVHHRHTAAPLLLLRLAMWRNGKHCTGGGKLQKLHQPATFDLGNKRGNALSKHGGIYQTANLRSCWR